MKEKGRQQLCQEKTNVTPSPALMFQVTENLLLPRLRSHRVNMHMMFISTISTHYLISNSAMGDREKIKGLWWNGQL